MTTPTPDGVLPVDKPPGPTSHDVVARARRALGTRRIGHTGTLDPFASGLLLLCVGWTTRLAEFLSGRSKTYDAVARLGERTDTLDREGDVVSRSEGWRDLAPAAVAAAFESQVGERMQVPPAYSAKKVGGERLYAKARRGETVEAEPVPVVIHTLEVTRVALPDVYFSVTCSSGTYVRAIARDAGVALGPGAHLRELRRTAIGAFSVDGAVALDALERGDVDPSTWISPLAALHHMPRIEVGAEDARALGFGQSPEAPSNAPAGMVAVAREGRLLAVAEAREGRLRPRKVFAHG